MPPNAPRERISWGDLLGWKRGCEAKWNVPEPSRVGESAVGVQVVQEEIWCARSGGGVESSCLGRDGEVVGLLLRFRVEALVGREVCSESL